MEPAASTDGAAEAAVGLTPLPPPGPSRARLVDARIALARQARAAGDRKQATDILVTTLRAGLWSYGRLWTEIVSLMDTSANYELVRSLWWQSPSGCQRLVPVIRAVARAASVAGEHDEARALLRTAILSRARSSTRLRSRLGRLKRRVIARLPHRPPSAAPFEHRAAAALIDLNRTLEEMGVRAFLISGTLLGYVRESHFIRWDKDIDLGIFTTEVKTAELEKAFDHSPVFDVRRLDFTTERLRVNHTNGMMIDLFPHYQDGEGRMWHDGTATRWWNTPFELTTATFLGMPVFVPDPPERYLDENYGNWRVPEADFDARIDAPNAEITDRDFFDTLLYFSLLEAILKNQPRKRRRYVDMLRNLGEGAWLDRV